MNRLEALALVDELLTAQAVFFRLAAEDAPRDVMMAAVGARDAARFRVVAAIAPAPLEVRVTTREARA